MPKQGYMELLGKLICFKKSLCFLVFLLYENCDILNAQTNLLENNSFEKILVLQDNIFIGWLCHNNLNVVRSRDYSYDGYYSAKMSSKEIGSTAIVNQVVEVVPNSRIRIRHHYYVTQWKDKGARMYCYFRERNAESSNLSNDYLSQFYDVNTLRIIRGGGYGLTYFPHELNQWLLFDEVITVPPNAHYFVFEIHSFCGTTIYVDDCYVCQDVESTVPMVNFESKELSSEYYTLTGSHLRHRPQKGNFLFRKIIGNGKTITRKVIAK